MSIIVRPWNCVSRIGAGAQTLSFVMLLLWCCACSSAETNSSSGGTSVTQPLTHEAVMSALEGSGNWELAPHTVRIASPDEPAGDEAVALYGSAGADANDEIWYASDGER